MGYEPSPPQTHPSNWKKKWLLIKVQTQRTVMCGFVPHSTKEGLPLMALPASSCDTCHIFHFNSTKERCTCLNPSSDKSLLHTFTQGSGVCGLGHVMVMWCQNKRPLPCCGRSCKLHCKRHVHALTRNDCCKNDDFTKSSCTGLPISLSSKNLCCNWNWMLNVAECTSVPDQNAILQEISIYLHNTAKTFS